MTTIKGKNSWIDILKPNERDLEVLRQKHKFHPLILKELLEPSARARVENYGDYIFLVYHLPVYDPEKKVSRRAEIDFLITKNLIITARYEPLEQLDPFLQELLRDAHLQKEMLSKETFIGLHRLMLRILHFSQRQLRHIEDQVEFIAREIFKNKEIELLRHISLIKRNILDYRLIVRPHENLFHSLREIGEEFWGTKSTVYLRDLSGESLKAIQSLENYFQIIESLESTNAQLLNANTNTIIKRFTILAFLFSIPLFFVFMLNIPYISSHILTSAARFWFTFLGIFALVGVLAYNFRKRNLL